MYFDSTFIILIPAILISLFAQSKVKSTFVKYSNVKSNSSYSGFEVARSILDRNGLGHVRIEAVAGNLTDHYDPRNEVLRLSDAVYGRNTIAAYGVAAHEVGHAIQHAKHYMPLEIRNSLVPVVNFSSRVVWLLIIGGMLLSMTGLIQIGIVLFSAVVLFQIVTLPVEFDASRRAIVQLDDLGILYDDEIKGARKVLDAAALTYVAAALTAVSQLIRLLLISNRGRRN
ncbi:MAG: zinc metallopeptidase [Tissierellales bacterium]|nr:zinc metallopeptidase [Tissierellales bacterium]MBN2827692.1 zinc metallopeptidase [Tissierellales bacterium]